MIANIILSILFGLLFVGVVVIIIFDNGDSGTKLAWLLAITFLPVLGIVLYLMLGINYRHHALFRRRHNAAIKVFTEEKNEIILRLLQGEMPFDKVDASFRPLARLLSNSQAGSNLSLGKSLQPAAENRNSC